MNNSPYESLRSARRSVKRALEVAAKSNGLRVTEDGLTFLALVEAARSHQIDVYSYTPHDEAHLSGSDWIWWWQGPNGKGFAALVQAKRVKSSWGLSCFDYDYRTPSTGVRQIDRLMSAGSMLGVPALYVLYTDPQYGKPSFACPVAQDRQTLAAATFLSAYEVDRAHSESRSFRGVHPLECMACDRGCSGGRGDWFTKSERPNPLGDWIGEGSPAEAVLRALTRRFTGWSGEGDLAEHLTRGIGTFVPTEGELRWSPERLKVVREQTGVEIAGVVAVRADLTD